MSDPMHERLLASHCETDDDLDGPPTREVIAARIDALHRLAAEEAEADEYWSAGTFVLKAENWERRLAGMVTP